MESRKYLKTEFGKDKTVSVVINVVIIIMIIIIIIISTLMITHNISYYI